MKSIILEWCKRNYLIVFGILLIFVILFFTVSMWKRKFPENEWHSRRGCRINLLQIESALEQYLEKHNNRMPATLNELVEEGHIHKSRFVCPSKYNQTRKTTDSSIEYSYRIVTPSIKIDDSGDEIILIEEQKYNHPESVVGDIPYPGGYFVIMAKKGELVIEFLEK